MIITGRYLNGKIADNIFKFMIKKKRKKSKIIKTDVRSKQSKQFLIFKSHVYLFTYLCHSKSVCICEREIRKHLYMCMRMCIFFIFRIICMCCHCISFLFLIFFFFFFVFCKILFLHYGSTAVSFVIACVLSMYCPPTITSKFLL